MAHLLSSPALKVPADVSGAVRKLRAGGAIAEGIKAVGHVIRNTSPGTMRRERAYWQDKADNKKTLGRLVDKRR